MTADSSDSIGIDPKVHIPDISDEPSAEFVHDRWPLFTIISGDFKIKIQFFASDGTIYQSGCFMLWSWGCSTSPGQKKMTTCGRTRLIYGEIL
jgi:hypothetical protein